MAEFTPVDIPVSARIGRLVKNLYAKMPEIETDRAVLLTESYKATEGMPIVRRRALAFKHILENLPVTIAVNYVPANIKVDYIFLTKTKRYNQLIKDMLRSSNKAAKIIATSNVTKTAGKFDYVLNYGSLIDTNTEIVDNSLVMLLKFLLRIGVNSVSLAGFDGYSKVDDNYFDISREYSFVKEKADYFNTYVRNFLVSKKSEIQVEFITESCYE